MSKPSYDEIVDRHDVLGKRNLELVAELVAEREARAADLVSFARRGSNGDLLRREVGRCIEELEAWRSKLNPFSHPWETEMLKKLVGRLSAAADGAGKATAGPGPSEPSKAP